VVVHPPECGGVGGGALRAGGHQHCKSQHHYTDTDHRPADGKINGGMLFPAWDRAHVLVRSQEDVEGHGSCMLSMRIGKHRQAPAHVQSQAVQRGARKAA